MSETYYDTFWKDTSKKAEPKCTEGQGTCGHKKGDCVWDRCPKCREHTLHKYMTVRNSKIVDVEDCLNCNFKYEEQITKY